MKKKRVLLKIFSCLVIASVLMTLCACTPGDESAGSSDLEFKGDSPIAKVIKTKYPTNDTVVAQFIATDYGADPTGQKDSTNAIRDALLAAKQAGGGTVWMPAGIYTVSSTITVSANVTLRGDWQDPDADNFDGDYGTVIQVKLPSMDLDNMGVIGLSNSAGIEGITFYYPDQSIEKVKPYPWTVYILSSAMESVRNCTFINAYRGISTAKDPHEMLSVSNVRGTFLKTGIFNNNSSDVGTVDGLSISPKYWAQCKLGNAPTAKEITQWCKENKSAALLLTDVEQEQYYNISIEGHYYGIYFPCIATRYMGAGSFYQLNIKDCVYGMYAPEGIYPSTRDARIDPELTNIDFRWGYNVANSTIEGSEYSIANLSSSVNGKVGRIKLSGVTLKGATAGTVDMNSANADLSAYQVNTQRVTKTTGNYFVQIHEGMSEQYIQQALDAAGKAGGGVVFISAGKYEISKGLKVPANVELHGAAGTAQRHASGGTVFLARQQGVRALNMLNFDSPLVHLAGDNAGISGIFLLYDENIYSVDKDKKYQFYDYAVRGSGKGVWAIDCCISGSTHGIDFRNCDNHVINHLTICSFFKPIHVSGNNGLVANCLQNGTVLYRTNYLTVSEANHAIATQFCYPIERVCTDYITIEEGSGQQIVNCFIYGGKNYLVSNGAENLAVINPGADNLADPGIGNMFVMNGGSACIINALRYNGTSLKNKGCDLRLFNRMGINEADEADEPALD